MNNKQEAGRIYELFFKIAKKYDLFFID